MKTLGIIGGLGPMATVYCMELILRMTDASRDQDHLRMLVHSIPDIPDRTSYLLGLGTESPLERMVGVGRQLKASGADCLITPCVTAHAFCDELEARIGLPFIHMVRETCRYLADRGVRSAGILATDGTVQSGFLQQELARRQIQPVLPSPDRQADVMHLIYANVKAGKPVELGRFQAAADELRQRGAEVTLLGCTELSVIKRDHPLGPGILDALEVLAQRAVELCGAPLAAGFRELITQ